MWGRNEHPRLEDLIRMVDDEASPAERARLQAHLQACSVCTAKRAAMASTLSAVDGLHRGGEGPDAATSAARARLVQSLRTLRRHGDAARSTHGVAHWTVARRWSLAAAGLLLGVGVWTMGARVADPPRAAARPVSALPGASGVALPRLAATPGAVSAHTAAELCAGVGPSRLVTDDTRRQVLRTYAMEHVPAAEYELDALITPELGGTTEAANLWPQLYASPVWNARVKDEIERLLPELVCRGEVDLVVAQRAIATDWIAAYQRYFNTDVPLQAHRGAPTDDDELVMLPAVYASR